MIASLEIHPVSTIDALVADLLILATHLSRDRWTPGFKKRVPKMTQLLTEREAANLDTPLTSAVSALAIWGHPEVRHALVTEDPVVALVRLLYFPNPLISVPLPLIPAPKMLHDRRGDPDTVADSYARIATFFTSVTSDHMNWERYFTAGEILVSKLVDPAHKDTHRVMICPRCLSVMTALRGGIRTMTDPTIRETLPWICTVLVAAYTGVNSGVVEQMLERGPS